MTGLPANVQAGADKATELINQLNETPKDKKVDENKDSTDKGTEKTEIPGNTSNADDNAAVQKSKADDPPQQDVTPKSPETSEDFKTKYLSLQGKYNAEIPRLHNDVRILRQQMDLLTTENQQLKEADNNKKSDHQDLNTSVDNSTLDPESMDSYGPEFKIMAEQMNQLTTENQQLKQQIGNVEQNIGSVQQAQGKSAYDKYLEQVKNQVKKAGADFNQLNADPNFLVWLKEIHPYTGQPRHASLQQAEQQFDVDRTMMVFNEYLNSKPPSGQQQSPPQQQQPKQQPNIQPDNRPSSSDVQPPGTSQGRIWTRQQIKQLYAEKAAGEWQHKDVDFKALESDMFKAQQEGRVQ